MAVMNAYQSQTQTQGQTQGQETSVLVHIPGYQSDSLPYQLAGQSVQVAAGRLEVHIQEMPSDLYRHLLAGTQPVHVSVSQPAGGTPRELKGRVVRFAFHKLKVFDKCGPCFMGIDLV